MRIVPRAPSTGVGSGEVHADADEPFDLVLYVVGMGPGSTMAIPAVRALCERHLAGRYALEVVALEGAWIGGAHEQIWAAPTLIRRRPPPSRRVVGDLTDDERILTALDLPRGVR